MPRFLNRWRYGFSAVLLLLSSLALQFTPLVTSVANAVSVWDDTIQSVTDLKVSKPSYANEQTLTDTWIDLLQTGNSDPCSSGEYSDFQTALASGKVLVSQYISGSSEEQIFIVWSTSGTPPTISYPGYWENGGGVRRIYSPSGTGSASITVANGGPFNNQAVVSCTNDASLMSGYWTADNFYTDTGANRYAVYVNSYTITYPTDYEGETPLDNLDTNIQPLIVVSTSGSDGKTITIQVDPSTWEQYDLDQPVLAGWCLQHESDTGIPGVDECLWNGSDPANGIGNLIDQTTVSTLGDYKITLYYLGWVGSTDPTGAPDGYNIVPTVIHFKIDGSTYVQQSNAPGGCRENDLECQLAVEDERADVYDDCGAYFIVGDGDFNPGRGILCVLGNFGKFLSNWISDLFRSAGFPDLSAPFTSSTTNTHGLTSIILAPLDALNTLTTAECEPIEIPFPFTGASMTLPCYYDIYEDHLGSVFTLYQVVVSGVIAYYVIVGFLAIVKGFKDPEENKIEVLKL